MKATFAILALATTALANVLEARWSQTTTLTTYTTTTVCPATTTKTEGGKTQIITTLTTSTITVTACQNCETTVEGPTTTD
jgi:hypothetical protein